MLEIPDKILKEVDRELEHGERVKWSAMAIPRIFSSGVIVLFLFTLFWNGFMVFWIAGASDFKIPDFSTLQGFFPLLGIPFLLIGIFLLYLSLGAYLAIQNTAYFITDKRAIIIEGGLDISTESYYVDNLKNLFRRERKDGTGDVVFRIDYRYDEGGDNRSEEIGFIGVENPYEVERTIKRMVEENVGY